jgi:hypothetical protein
MGRRVKIGDVIQIPTKRGFAYAQYTHYHKKYSALIQVAPGFFKVEPSDMDAILELPPKFIQFFPLQASVDKKIFKVIGNYNVLESRLTFPLFRNPGFVDKNGKVHNWYIWDGHQSVFFDKLTWEQEKLPILGICNDTALIETLEETEE